jgi:hypothetical protein
MEPDRILLIRGNYRAVFLEYRKHLIDLNILALHNEAVFYLSMMGMGLVSFLSFR